MNEDTVVFIVFIGLIAIFIVVAVIRALFSDKYDKGKMDEYEEQQEYYSWLHSKDIDDLIIRKIVPMVELLSSSGNNHTMTRTEYNKHEEFVELENGAILDKNHIEQRRYFFLGEGVINESGKFTEKKQLILFKVDGKEFKSKDDIEWMTTYALYRESEFESLIPFRKGSLVLAYCKEEDAGFFGEKGHWAERLSENYNRYFSLMDKVHREELKYSE